MKKLLSLFLASVLILFSGCGSTSKNEPKTEAEKNVQALQEASESTKPVETELGFAPEEVEKPSWLKDIWAWDTYNDTIWLGAISEDEGFIIASYDTVADSWESIPIDLTDVHNPIPFSMSVADNSIWILLSESYSDSDIKEGLQLDLGYYLCCINLKDNSQLCTKISIDGAVSSEGSGETFSSIMALDDGRALLATYETTYLIDPEANILEIPELPVLGEIIHFRVNNTLYMLIDSGFAQFDKNTLEFGSALPMENIWRYSSNSGNYFVTENQILYKYDISSGAKEELFNWMDVSLSYNNMGGSTLFENSAGELYYPISSGIVKVVQKQIPIKQELTLLFFNDSTSEKYQYSGFTYPDVLLDAAIRFNNTDPEYKIRLEPMVFGSSTERDKLLIEIATSDNIDLIDTSMLPDNSMDSGLLVDMMPYITNDDKISKDDFIEPLLNSMMKNGGLYEYTDRFTILTLLTHKNIFTGHENWTVDNIGQIMNDNQLDCLSRERLVESFILASTAEFIDWNTSSCSFESNTFIKWLEFLNSQPEVINKYDNPIVFQISNDLAGDAGLWAREMLNGEYSVAGFPNTEETGSYFVKLSGMNNPEMPTLGENTRLGIMASCKYPQGAWRFIRTLMLGDSDTNIAGGIPVLKDKFEKVLEKSTDNESFTSEDAASVKEQVYNTSKLVSTDEALLDIIRSEMNEYFGGKGTAQQCAAQIQNRVNIYLAEHS